MATTPWELLNQVFTVERIMTPRDRLLTWEEGTNKKPVLEEAKARRFDLIPITKGNRITGIMRRGKRAGSLTEGWLIAASTGVADLLDAFAKSRQPGFLVLRCQDVVGLVTPGDLNKIEVRAYVYNLVGQLEIGLGKMVREAYPDESKVLGELSDKRRGEIERLWQQTQSGNVDLGVVACLNLVDLFHVIRKNDLLYGLLGYTSGSKVGDELEPLNELRNCVMHPVRPFVWDAKRDVVAQHKLIESARHILQRLEELENVPKVATSVVAA